MKCVISTIIILIMCGCFSTPKLPREQYFHNEKPIPKKIVFGDIDSCGNKVGLWVYITIDQDSSVRNSCNYSEGKLDGLCVTIVNGDTTKVKEYEQGHAHGKCWNYHNGRISSIAHYHKDTLVRIEYP